MIRSASEELFYSYIASEGMCLRAFVFLFDSFKLRDLKYFFLLLTVIVKRVFIISVVYNVCIYIFIWVLKRVEFLNFF